MLQSSGFPILSDCQPKLARSRIQRFPVQRPLTPTRDLSQFAAFFIGVWNRAIHLLASYLNPFFALLNPISLAFAGIIDQNDLKDSCDRPFYHPCVKRCSNIFIVCQPLHHEASRDAHPILLLPSFTPGILIAFAQFRVNSHGRPHLIVRSEC